MLIFKNLFFVVDIILESGSVLAISSEQNVKLSLTSQIRRAVFWRRLNLLGYVVNTHHIHLKDANNLLAISFG